MQIQTFKTDYCNYCFGLVQAPLNQSIVKCAHCKKLNIFLCHIINTEQNLNDIICLKCSNNLILLNCPSCGGFQGYSKSQANFKNGMKYQCPSCQSISTLVICNSCQSLISIKGKRSHQLALIKCKKCEHEFKYRFCEQCQLILYKQKWDQSEEFVCLNANCKNSDVRNPYDLGNYNENQHFTNRVSQFQKNFEANQNAGSKQERQLCKVCFNSEADMINTKCFHLAVCEICSKELKNECPICRSKGGQFKKVFKA